MKTFYEPIDEKHLDDILGVSEIYCAEFSQRMWAERGFDELIRTQRTIARKFAKMEPATSSFLAMESERFVNDALSILDILRFGDKLGTIDESILANLYHEFKYKMSLFATKLVQVRSAFLKERGFSQSSETENLRRTALAIKDDFPWLSKKFSEEAENIDFKEMFLRMMEEEKRDE